MAKFPYKSLMYSYTAFDLWAIGKSNTLFPKPNCNVFNLYDSFTLPANCWSIICMSALFPVALNMIVPGV